MRKTSAVSIHNDTTSTFSINPIDGYGILVSAEDGPSARDYFEKVLGGSVEEIRLASENEIRFYQRFDKKILSAKGGL